MLAGGQAMRLAGLPRFSMDWDFFIPPQDEVNLARPNVLLAEELDMPLVPLGPQGANFVQTSQTPGGVVQFYLGLPRVPKFDGRSIRQSFARLNWDCRSMPVWSALAAKQAANRPQDQVDIEFLTELQRLGKL